LTPQEPESLPNLSESPLDSPAGTAKAASFPSIWSAGAAADRARPWRTVRALGGFGADLSREAGGIGWRILRGAKKGSCSCSCSCRSRRGRHRVDIT
jgi:hypothetical protein